jgi:hypothetical protein
MRLRRSRWRREIEVAERDWAECDEGERFQMRAELRSHLHDLREEIAGSILDQLTRAGLLARIDAFLVQIS